MVRLTLAIALSTALASGTAYAQNPTATPTAQEKPAPKPVPPEGQPNNIRVELAITDQAGPGAPTKRTLSVIVADRHTGNVRNQGAPMQPARVATLNVDVTPTIIKDGTMRVQLGLEYYPASGEGANDARSLNQRLTLLMESGKPLVVSQASDPASDRKLAVELTATILK
jgi:hypothetical protein